MKRADLRRRGLGQAHCQVTIHALVLEGFSSAERLPIAAALGAELSRLIRSQGLPEGLLGGAGLAGQDGTPLLIQRSLPQLSAGDLPLLPLQPSHATGTRLAGLVYAALVQGETSPKNGRQP